MPPQRRSQCRSQPHRTAATRSPERTRPTPPFQPRFQQGSVRWQTTGIAGRCPAPSHRSPSGCRPRARATQLRTRTRQRHPAPAGRVQRCRMPTPRPGGAGLVVLRRERHLRAFVRRELQQLPAGLRLRVRRRHLHRNRSQLRDVQLVRGGLLGRVRVRRLDLLLAFRVWRLRILQRAPVQSLRSGGGVLVL